MEHDDICFEVTGSCLDFTAPRYKINHVTAESSDYNVTHSFWPSKSTLCLKNVTQRTVVTEECEYITDISFCQSGGDIVKIYLSRTEVHLHHHIQVISKYTDMN